MTGRFTHAVLSVLLLSTLACGREPAAISYGEENCAYCRMTVSDTRFGAQHVSRTGKVRSFDSIECLAGYHLTSRAGGEPRALLVTDMERPGTLIRVQDARFLRAEGVHTPMGLGIVAVAGARGDGVLDVTGEEMTWDEVLALVENSATVSATRHDARYATASHVHAN